MIIFEHGNNVDINETFPEGFCLVEFLCFCSVHIKINRAMEGALLSFFTQPTDHGVKESGPIC